MGVCVCPSMVSEPMVTLKSSVWHKINPKLPKKNPTKNQRGSLLGETKQKMNKKCCWYGLVSLYGTRMVL